MEDIAAGAGVSLATAEDLSHAKQAWSVMCSLPDEPPTQPAQNTTWLLTEPWLKH